MQTLLQSFDEVAFKARFRAAAARRGIDPEQGANSYQAALVGAELRRQATVSAPDYGWWKTRSIWSGDADLNERPTETRARDRGIEDLVPLNDETVAELWREIVRELHPPSEKPLKGLHLRQRAWGELREKRASEKRQRVRWSSVGGMPIRDKAFAGELA